jgi:hypothetical protein
LFNEERKDKKERKKSVIVATIEGFWLLAQKTFSFHDLRLFNSLFFFSLFIFPKSDAVNATPTNFTMPEDSFPCVDAFDNEFKVTL